MSADSQVLQFPLASGLDEGADPKQVPPGVLARLVNQVWRKDRRLDKRWGTSSLPKTIAGGGSLSTALRLVPRDDGLGLIDNDNLYAYSASSASWRMIRQLSQFVPTWSTALDTARGVASWDAVKVGAFEVLVWCTGDPLDSTILGTAWISIRDTSTGAVVLSPTLLLPNATAGSSAVQNVRVLTDGALAYVIVQTNTNAMYGVTVTPSTGALAAPVAMATTNNPIWDACFIGSNIVITWARLAIATARILAVTPSTWALGAPVDYNVGGVQPNVISVAGDSSDAIYVLYGNTTNGAGLTVLNPSTFALTAGPTVVDAQATHPSPCSPLWISSGTVLLCWNQRFNASTNRARCARSALYTGGAVDANSRRGTWGTSWCSRPVSWQGRYFAALVTATTRVAESASLTTVYTDPPTSVVVEVETSAKPGSTDWVPHRRLGTVDILIGGYPATDRILASPVVVDSSTLALYVAFQATATLSDKASRQGLRRVVLQPRTTAAADYGRNVTVGRSTFLNVGQLACFDGVRAPDYLFVCQPSVYAKSAIGGGGMVAGTYTYSVVAEYRGADGLLQRSRPSNPTSYTLALSNVQFSVQPETLDHHEADLAGANASAARSVTLAEYRGPKDDATILYRLSVDPNFNVIVNDPFSGTVTLSDNSTDANIDGQNTPLTTRPPLYTTGGILEDYQPPTFVSLALHRNRLWGIIGTRRELWFSKSFQDDIGVAPGFHPNFRFVIDEDLVVVRSMDDKLVAFSATRPYFLPGDGPAPNGQGSDFPGALIPVAAESGCTNPRAIAETPAGIIFLGARGFYLLTRGLEVQYIGRPVEDTLAAFPNVTSGVLVPKSNHVRFTCNSADGLTGCVVVCDYQQGQWSTATYTDPATGSTSTPIADACLWRGVWTFVTPAGKVYQEAEGSYLDDGTAWVYASGELCDITAGGALGFQRIRKAGLLGQRLTDCDLTLSFSYDEDATWTQAFTWRSDKLAQFGRGANVTMRTQGSRGRCRAFRLRWADAPPTGPGAVTGTGQGCTFSAIGLEIKPRTGMDRRSARARS